MTKEALNCETLEILFFKKVRLIKYFTFRTTAAGVLSSKMMQVSGKHCVFGTRDIIFKTDTFSKISRKMTSYNIGYVVLASIFK